MMTNRLEDVIVSGLPRWMHHAWAWFGGYFWLPCKICGQPFGGHEHKRCVVLYESQGRGWLTCPNCKEETKKRNRENGFEYH